MDDTIKDDVLQPEADGAEVENQPDVVQPDVVNYQDGGRKQLTGMYQNWFLDYASYVILERAVPHLADGFKPVQRRIMHSMKRLDDGRYNKVANIVGHTMQFHPHGDASIGDALVQLGQKDLLVDCQGNWGNILTGDGAAAPRYIEARLSKFALDVVFNPKTTDWKLSYDGRNKEPVTLPVKFPLLLAQGAEGIAVGLSAKILPHNLGEICEAAVKFLHDEPFELYPDFQTGGLIDVRNYNDGLRGGSVRVRAKIEKIDAKTIAIREIPFGKTTSSLIDSILRANERGKIKIRRVDDNTAAEVEILIQLAPGVSSDKTIDALYAFTDCEVSISPNCCVIDDKRPCFMPVSEVLKAAVLRTKDLLRHELEIRKGELLESLHYASLERIFIEERIYKGRPFEQAKSNDEACEYIDERLTPFYSQFVREVTKEDILRLLDIKMASILRFNKQKADEAIARMKDELARIEHDLGRMTEVTVEWFNQIHEKYADAHPRRTEIRAFDTIVATKVAEANQKLYINRVDGFIGTGLKKDEFVENCSDIDDIIIFYRDGTFKVVRVSDKVFIGETARSKEEKRKAEVIHIAVFRKNDKRTTYNAVYRDGPKGAYYIKRFNVTGVTRDREIDITRGKKGSKVIYFTANPNGEAEVIKVTLKPQRGLRKMMFDRDFSELMVKGRGAKGNLVTRLPVYRIQLKSHGGSTLGGRKVWFDHDVQRLNFDDHGQYLGEFQGDDMVLIVRKNGDFYTTNFDPNNHYENDLLMVRKFDPSQIFTVALFDASQQGCLYIKRFCFEKTLASRPRNFLGENPDNQMLVMSEEAYPRLRITYGGADAGHEPVEVECEEFVAVKGWAAKGKRFTALAVAKVEEIEPLRKPEPPAEPEPASDAADENVQEDLSDQTSITDIEDELTGQQSFQFE